MSKKFIITSFTLILLLGSLGLLSSVQGAGLLPAATGAKCSYGSKDYCGNYSLNDFVSLAINISKWVLGIVGSLTLIMFIYGGFMFLISGGSAEAISKAKKIIIAAIIGLFIVFASYLIIKFVLASMGLNWNGNIAKPKVANVISINTIS